MSLGFPNRPSRCHPESPPPCRAEGSAVLGSAGVSPVFLYTGSSKELHKTSLAIYFPVNKFDFMRYFTWTRQTEPDSPTARRHRRIAQVLLGVMLLLSALGLFSLHVWTAPLGWAWHLFHGRYTTFEGRKVRVPWDMLVHRSGDGALMIKRSGTKYAFFKSPAGAILISRTHGHKPDLSKEYDIRTNLIAGVKASSGFRLREVRKISADKGFEYCWEFMQSDFRTLDIDCVFNQNSLSVIFLGSPEYRERFYSVLADLSYEPSELKR